MPIDYDVQDGGDKSPTDGYFAAVPLNDPRMAGYVAARVREHYEDLEGAGLIDLYRLTHTTYYGLNGAGRHVSSKVIEFGEQGEKLGVKSNQMRSLTRYIHLTATQNQPAMKPRAINSTPDALAQIPAAKRILEYYDRELDMRAVYSSAALRCLLYGVGYIWQSWDPFAGPIGPDGRPTGDLIARAASKLDVASDLDVENGQHDWFAVRVRRNRYDQVALYTGVTDAADPKAVASANNLREKLLNAPQDLLASTLGKKLSFWHRKSERKNSDSVFEYHFMHRKTPSVPEGRYTIIAADETILFDGPLPYDKVPVDVMLAEEFLEMGDVGYSSAWDLLGLQSVYDAAMSICATNMDAFGQNDIMIPEGVEVGYEELRDGLNIIRYPMGEMNKPEILEKFSIKKEFFEFKDWVKGDMEVTVGVNSVARGEPQASLESGSALALVQAQAVTAQGPYVSAYGKLVARSSSNRIKILQRHLPEDRVIAIAGSDDPDSIKAFSTPQIGLIDRVEVDDVNPLHSTPAGRAESADKMLERGLIASPHAYIQFQETGRLETVTDDSRRKDLFGRRVREVLQSGPAVQTQPGAPDPMTGLPGPDKQFIAECRYVITDDPRICLQAASSVLDSFDLRQDPKVLGACVAYMTEVLDTWRATDPDTLALLQYPAPAAAIARAQGLPMDPNAVNQPGGGAPGAPKPGGPGQPGKTPAGDPAAKPQDDKPPPAGSSQPSLPKPAENPF